MKEITAYRCDSCGEVSDGCLWDTLYECGSCGSRFTRSNSADGDSHRCPNDNKFGSKVTDQACASCEEGEVEEVTGYQCEVCSHILIADEMPDKCPECEENEMRKQELDRLAKLPVSERGGQKVFATKEEALGAFSEFLGAVKSEHISLVPSEDYETKDTSGVGWAVDPKPTVSFHFEVATHYNDPYIAEEEGNYIYLTNLFYEDVKKVAIKYLRGTPEWNSSRSHGWVGHYGEKTQR